MLNRDFEGSASLSLFHKDLGLAHNAANENGVALPSADVARQLYQEVLNHWPEANHLSSVLLALEGSAHEQTVADPRAAANR